MILDSIFCLLDSILCTFGLSVIDENLDSLLSAMSGRNMILPSFASTAKLIGACIALGVGSYECWMMMLGKRAIDIFKIIHIIIISICITSSSWIVSTINSIAFSIENSSKVQANSMNQQVSVLEKEVADLQSTYLRKLREVQDSIQAAQQVAELGEDPDLWDEIKYHISHLGEHIENLAQQATVAIETKVSEWINDAIRFICELLFQMMYYGMLVGQRCFMGILASVLPLYFALSLAPPWRSCWSQWFGKYISLSLWGFVVYCIIFYVDFILVYNLQLDRTAYEKLLGGSVNSWENIGALGLQAIGTTCSYAMGLLVGAFMLKMVPEVASWLIPGGVSSGMGHQAGGAVTGASMSAGKAAANYTARGARALAGAAGV